MKTFSELEHMRLYRQPLMVPFEEKNKKKGTVVHLLTSETMQAADIIRDKNLKNPRLIEGYYIDKGIAHLISEDETTIEESYITERVIEDRDFDTPEEFSKWMKQNIKYKEFDKLMSPEEVLIKKRGSCHDQALFEYDVFNENFALPKKLLFFVEYNENESSGGMTHTLLYYTNKDNKLYWFENAWGGQEGIHGPYKDVKALKMDVEVQHAKLPSAKRYPKLEWGRVSRYKLKPGMNLGDYVDLCLGPVNESVEEQSLEEAGVGAGMAAGYLTKLAWDAALKYGKKYIDAKEAKTPTQKQTAAVVFMGEYKKGKKAFEKFKSVDNRPFRNTTPDAWWISWFGVTSSDIKAIGSNERNKVNNTKFQNMVTNARKDSKIVDKFVGEFENFLKNKDFFLISSAVEDNGKVIPFKVEYFYCPQTDKIYSCSGLNGVIKLDYKHPVSISDYLNRSKKSMLEIKDVLKICEEKDKSGE